MSNLWWKYASNLSSFALSCNNALVQATLILISKAVLVSLTPPNPSLSGFVTFCNRLLPGVPPFVVPWLSPFLPTAASRIKLYDVILLLTWISRKRFWQITWIGQSFAATYPCWWRNSQMWYKAQPHSAWECVSGGREKGHVFNSELCDPEGATYETTERRSDWAGYLTALPSFSLHGISNMYTLLCIK